MGDVQAPAEPLTVSPPRNGHASPAAPSSADALPSTGAPSSAEARFAALAAKWRHETWHLSSVTQTAMHPAYQKIIGLGQPAIPLILRELQVKPSPHWFWALDALAESPPGELAAAEHMTVEDVAQAWLRWGRDRRYIQ